MIDQQHINLLNLIGGDLKKVGGTGGGEFHGPCPFCGGKDRFIVQPHADNGGHWWCRQCGRNGDPVGFIMQSQNVGFKEACDQLRIDAPLPPQRHRSPLPQPTVQAGDLKEYECFNPAWQQAAYDFAYDCAGVLWDNWNSSSAARYLEQRGINQNTAIASFIGVNPADYRATWGNVEVWLPRGIVIPWEINQQLWNVRVRRPNADLSSGDKYISAKGTANGMYRVDMVVPGQTIVMTEGEFDALVIERMLLSAQMDHISAVSIGSSAGARVLRWITRLSLAERVLLAFDNDTAGDQAANYWLAALPRKARRLRPSRKDATEMLEYGELNLDWFSSEVC